MTGKLTLTCIPITAEERKYLRLILELDDGSAILFQDARRFGRTWIATEQETSELDGRMGPEPLSRSFNANGMERLLSGRTRPIKSTLLDQGIIAGIGNIYADEALYGARIHPQRPSGSLSRKEIEKLTISIKETLRRAIRLQGSSIDSYRDSRGGRGRFQETFKVHRREGEPCHACGGIVEKIKVGGRGTYFCPSCQKLK
jgi:formamidopyrimidine-DNA glycosylase